MGLCCYKSQIPKGIHWEEAAQISAHSGSYMKECSQSRGKHIGES
jgi:hypothetical protein